MVGDGYDETLTIDTCSLRYLYQRVDGAMPSDHARNPYRLGLLTSIQ